MREQTWGGNDISNFLADARGAAFFDGTFDGGRALRYVAIAALLFSGACASLGHRRLLGGSIEESWSDAETTAQVDAANGRFAAADSVLSGYALRHPGTPEALETAYWRAVYGLDPQNKTASLTEAMASLDAYLADSRPRQHVVEAMTLRHIGTELQELHRAAAAAASEAREASKDAANAKAAAADANANAKASDTNASSSDAAEVKRLREELAKANAELERIKKRLAPPPKP